MNAPLAHHVGPEHLPYAPGMAVRTFASAFRSSVVRDPNGVAVIFDGGAVSFALLDSLANRLANGMLALARATRPCVAIIGENSLEHALVFVAAAKAGLAVASLNWRLSSDELRDAIDVAVPDVIVVSDRFMDACGPWLDEYVKAGRVVSIGRYERVGAAPLQFWRDVIGRARSSPPEAMPAPEDILSIMFTSGSTGQPKAAAISHRALVARGTVMSAEIGLGRSETFVAWAPLSHMVSSDYLLINLMLGAPTVIVDGFDTARIVRILARRRVAWLPVMPGSHEALVAEIERTGQKPRALRMIGAMADLLSPDLIATVTTATGAQFFNSFGSTEAGTLPVPSTLIPVGHVPTQLRKRQSPFCDVRLVDDAGRDVPVETPGEMLLRGPTLFSGYWRNASGTATDIFADGWFRTGDVMVRHDDGTLDFIDRVKYMIKSGGENIYPGELERVLLSHVAVAEATVVRAKDDRWGERPVAFVALHIGHQVDAAELIELCRQRLAPFKRPRDVVFIAADQFPRNVTGKVVRAELERMVGN